MIRHDESVPVRSRRRNIYLYSPLDLSGKMRYPHGKFFLRLPWGLRQFSIPPDALPVAKWVKTQYGPRSPLVAVFMTHAVINGNVGVSFHIIDLHFHLFSYTRPGPSLLSWHWTRYQCLYVGCPCNSEAFSFTGPSWTQPGVSTFSSFLMGFVEGRPYY